MSVLSKVESSILLSARSSALKQAVCARWSYSEKSPSHGGKTFHKTSSVNYPPIKALPLPNNVEDIAESEKARFSPLRSRDINGSLIAGDVCRPSADLHLSSYDCVGSISLSSSMQTNVPQPCREQGLYTHFNMPGGLWRQGEKYVAADHIMSSTLLRHFSTKPKDEEKALAENSYATLSRKEKLKTAVKEYGSVVIVFHVGISLVSLGACYLAVTSGIDFSSVLNRWQSTDGAGAATTAAPFVVAYAIHKVFAPVRISITLVSVPFIVKYLRRVGFVKPPKPQSVKKEA